MRTLCLWVHHVYENVMFMRTLGLGSGLGLATSCPTSIQAAEDFFSTSCASYLHIFHEYRQV